MKITLSDNPKPFLTFPQEDNIPFLGQTSIQTHPGRYKPIAALAPAVLALWPPHPWQLAHPRQCRRRSLASEGRSQLDGPGAGRGRAFSGSQLRPQETYLTLHCWPARPPCQQGGREARNAEHHQKARPNDGERGPGRCPVGARHSPKPADSVCPPSSLCSYFVLIYK